MGQREPWERRHDESAKAYAAFVEYRDAPPHSRSVYNGKTRRTHTWCAQFGWVERAAAYDDHLDKVRRAETELIARRGARDAARVVEGIIARAAREMETSEADVALHVPLMRACWDVVKHFLLSADAEVADRTEHERMREVAEAALARLRDEGDG